MIYKGIVGRYPVFSVCAVTTIRIYANECTQNVSGIRTIPNSNVTITSIVRIAAITDRLPSVSHSYQRKDAHRCD
jgi:hypothetical protein